jgi:DNA-binding MarR family transcriptional regulator
LRRSVRTNEPGQGFTVPSASTSLEELRLNLERIAARENRVDLYAALAGRAGLEIPPQSCWLLYRVADQPDCTVDAVSARLKVPPDVIEPGIGGLVAAGLVERTDGAGGVGRRHLRLTAAGDAAVVDLTDARRQGLTELLEGWDLDDNPEVVAMVTHLAEALLADDQKMLVAAGLHTTG